jgi:HAE1 family hydrophobic/amphiphilic exporter-1
MGASQSTPYKAEIDVQLVPKKDRADDANIYAARIKKELEPVLPGAKVKTVPVSILGSAEQAPLALIVTGPELDSVMVFARSAMNELKTVQGATEVRLSLNPEIPRSTCR